MRAPGFWQRDGIVPRLLDPVGRLAHALAALHRATTTKRRAAVPVVCVGNLTAGGAGKTPTAIAIAGRLIERGIGVHFLTRGYGGRARGPVRVDPASHNARDVGDEALLLARVAPTWTGADRRRSATAAVAAGAEALVMDDGFQNPSLHKDLSLVVIDPRAGFGNRRLVPAGPLREPIAAGLKRADAVVLIGAGGERAADLTGGGLPVLRAAFAPLPGAMRFKGQRVVAFAGIGRPAKFFETLDELGAQVVAAHAFPDHHAYAPEEIIALCEEASALAAEPVTTEKDWVRLDDKARPMVEPIPVELTFADEARLEEVLRPIVRRAAR